MHRRMSCRLSQLCARSIGWFIQYLSTCSRGMKPMDLTMPPTAGSDRSARERERLLARDRPAVRSWSRSTPLDSQPVLIFLGECSLLNLFLYSFISIRVITYEISCTSIRCIMSTHGVGLFARLAGCTDLVTSPTDVLPSFHAHACAIHQLNNTKPKTLKT